MERFPIYRPNRLTREVMSYKTDVWTMAVMAYYMRLEGLNYAHTGLLTMHKCYPKRQTKKNQQKLKIIQFKQRIIRSRR